jgi:hypothetical protein
MLLLDKRSLQSELQKIPGGELKDGMKVTHEEREDNTLFVGINVRR